MTEVRTTAKRIVSIQACRGVAVLAVLLAHLQSVEHKYCSSNVMNVFRYGVFGVDLFFVISGIVMAAVTYGKFGDRKYGLTFLYHRLARIFPVYWVYTTIVLVAYLYNPNLINAKSGHHANVLLSYLLVPTNHSMLVMQGWTLCYEIYFYAVTFVVVVAGTGGSLRWFLAGWSAVIVSAAARPSLYTQPVLQVVLSPLVLEFLAGFGLYYLYRATVPRARVGVGLIVAALVWLGGVVAYNAVVLGWHSELIEADGWKRAGLFGVFAVLLLAGAIELERSGLMRHTRALELVGDWSYSIYLSHIIVIEAIGRAMFHVAGRSVGTIYLIDLVAIPLSVLVGYVSFRWLETPLLAVFYQRKSSSPAGGRVKVA